MELSFVIPCLNEERTIRRVIQECRYVGEANRLDYEIIIADNGSIDKSVEIAKEEEVLYVDVKTRGYGAALMEGIAKSRGEYVVMGDADATYNFRDTINLLEVCRQGHDLVVGNRFKGSIEKGAMPWLHKYVGNPILSFIGQMFFDINIGDFHCGLRVFRKESIMQLNLKSKGMEFASEMIIKASLCGLSIDEFPTVLRRGPEGRIPHLKTWRDGWRHLKFMLSYSPRYSVIPVSIGILLLATVLLGCYLLKYSIFGGVNTIIFSIVLYVCGMSLLSDYILVSELVYASFPTKRDKNRFIDKILGTQKGVDRLYRFCGVMLFAVVLLSLFLIHIVNVDGAKSTIAYTVSSLIAIASVTSLNMYQTATKLNTFRSIFK